MESFLSRLRVALFLLVLLFAFGCGQFDSLVNGYQGGLGSGGGSGNGGGSGSGGGSTGGGVSNGNNFPLSCQRTLGRIASSVPIKITQISLQHSQGGDDFVINQEITMEGLDMARALDKALNTFGPIAPSKYKSISLKVLGAYLVLKPKLGGDIIDIHSASGELKINVSSPYVVSEDGKKGRVLFDICKNIVLQKGGGNGGDNDDDDGEDNHNEDDDNNKPKGCVLTPEVKAKVVYP